MATDFLSEHAREQLGMPEGWQAYHYRVVGDKPAQAYEITGAIPQFDLFGEPDWNKMDKTTERTAYLQPDQHNRWLEKWEERTGKCHKCDGTGQEPWGYSVESGARYRDCKRCDATGKPPTIERMAA